MTTIYILFREYADQTHQPSIAFINGVDFPLDAGTSILAEFNRFFDVVGFFDYEYANRLYDEANLKGLLYQSLELSVEYPGLATSIRSQLRSHGFTDWEDITTGDQEIISFHGNDVTSHLLGDFAHRHKTQEHTCKICFFIH